MVTDLTTGKPFKKIIQFCLPLMVGQLFQQFYNMVDSIIVGKFCGTAELSAVGSTGSINFLVIGFVLGCCTGFCIPMSQAFGEKDMKKLRKCYANSIYLTVILTVVITILTVTFVSRVLRLMNTPVEIIDMAEDYITIIFWGTAATFFYNMAACVMRSLGDSKTPLYLLIFSSLLNVALDLLFVIKLDMAVKGVAIATVIAQAVSAVLSFIIIKKKLEILRFEKGERSFSPRTCGRLLYNGLPMALQMSITAVGSIMLQSAVNGLGYTIVAAVTVATKVQLMLMLPSETVGATMATYCGQNFGAGRMDRVKEGMFKSMIIAAAYCLISVPLAHFGGSMLAQLFVKSTETEVIALIARFLRVGSYFYPILALIFLLRNSVQGLGYSLPAMMAGVFELVARALMGFWIIPKYGFDAVVFANPMAWIFADILLVPVFFITYNLAKKKIAARKKEQ